MTIVVYRIYRPFASDIKGEIDKMSVKIISQPFTRDKDLLFEGSAAKDVFDILIKNSSPMLESPNIPKILTVVYNSKNEPIANYFFHASGGLVGKHDSVVELILASESKDLELIQVRRSNHRFHRMLGD